MLIKANPNIQQVPDNEQARFTDVFLNDVAKVVNGGLDFQTNFNGKLITAAFSSANTDTAVAHNLGRAPQGYVVTSLSTNMVVYSGSTAADKNTITLKSSAAGSAGLFVF